MGLKTSKTKNMYKVKPMAKSSILSPISYEGETIEDKINRIVNNKEPIKDGAPLIYSERKDGVRPEYNIRTDRFEIAIDAMDAVSATHKAKREQRIKGEGKIVDMKKNNDGGAEPLQGTTTS